MENELVRYSRAGDVFHYRWAARRCLRMIHPKSSVKSIVIEGSKESKKAGEYVIDVAEYVSTSGNGNEQIAYFQLKHSTSTKRLEEAFTPIWGDLCGYQKIQFNFEMSQRKLGF
jgi:hypothetical protein